MKNKSLKILAEAAIMIALATVLSYVRIVSLPWGGSITLLSMLPIVIFGIRHGVVKGLEAAFVFSLIQFGQGVIDGIFTWGLTPVSLVACIFLDYIAAFTVLGLAGLFRKEGYVGWILGSELAILLRFVCHYLSGVLIWGSYGELWNGLVINDPYLYSLLYNGAYMLPEFVFTTAGAVALLSVPTIRRIISEN